MPAALRITRTDHTFAELNEIARTCKNRVQRNRIRGIALVLEGRQTRGRIAARCRVGLQTLRDWVIRYSEGGVEALADRPRGGRRGRLSAEQDEELRIWVSEGPGPEDGGITRWTVAMLGARVRRVFGVGLCDEAIRRRLHAWGFRRLSVRPRHPRADPALQETFRRDFRELAREALPEGTRDGAVDIWFQDESRVGQQGMLTRVWAQRGTRPRAPKDIRRGNCWLFAAFCHDLGKAVGHVCDRAHHPEMSRHLSDIGRLTAPGRHALVVLDGAGWHRAKDLAIPRNVSLLHLPPYSPELNPMETTFQYLKNNHFSNRVYEDTDHVRASVAVHWQAFTRQPELISSIARRAWATMADEVEVHL